MRTITLLLVFIVVCTFAYQCNSTQNIKNSPARDEVIQFIEGFALGIESDIGDVEKCVGDANVTLKNFESAFEDLQYGFSHLSVSHIEKGIQEFGAGVQEIAVLLKDCNATKLMEEIEKLAQDLKEGKSGIIKILYKEFIVITHHGKELTKDFKNAITYFKEKKFKLSGYQVGRIVGILLDY